MAEATGITEQGTKPPESSWKEIPKTDPKYENYFKEYSSKDNRLGNIFNLNRNGAFLFEHNDQPKHVIWQFNDRNGYGYWWDDVRTTPEITLKVSQDLLDLAERARGFYPWDSKIEGFVAVMNLSFGMNPGSGEGMNVNYLVLKRLISAYRENDQGKISEMKTHLAAGMVHELTHLEHDLRGDDSRSTGAGPEEIGPHIPQFLFDPKNNHFFNREKGSLDRLKSARDEGQPQESFGYDWAQYTALLVTADRLAEENPEIKDALEEDNHPSKIEGLKKVIDLAGEVSEQTRKAIAASFMEITNAQIVERARTVEGKLGITSNLV